MSTLLCVVMAASLSTTVKASENTEVGMFPMWAISFSGVLATSTSYTSWERTGLEVYCRHEYPFGTDLELSWTKLTYQQRNNYGIPTGVINSKEYQWECHGFVR